MRVLLGLFQADEGTAQITGVAVQKLQAQNFSEIGFIAESQIIPEWMLVKEYLNYHSKFYTTWDKEYCNNLCKNLELPLDRKIRHLSRGQRMKAMLVASVSFKPKVLLMDEPLSGLDPLVREEVTSVIIDLVNQTGTSILISSHDIDDVEKCCDYTGFLLAGKLCIESEVAALQAQTKLVRVNFESEQKINESLPIGWTLKSSSDRGFEAYIENLSAQEIDVSIKALSSGAHYEVISLSLKEVFLFHLRRNRSQRIGG